MEKTSACLCPYLLKQQHHLEQRVKPIRKAYRQWLYISGVAFVTSLLVTDEAGFGRDRIFN
jgi:hypothetical protein